MCTFLPSAQTFPSWRSKGRPVTFRATGQPLAIPTAPTYIPYQMKTERKELKEKQEPNSRTCDSSAGWAGKVTLKCWKSSKGTAEESFICSPKVGEKDRQDADVFDDETIKNSHAVPALKPRNNEQRTTRGHANAGTHQISHKFSMKVRLEKDAPIYSYTLWMKHFPPFPLY